MGLMRFEPTTSWSRTRRDTKLRYSPNNYRINQLQPLFDDGRLMVAHRILTLISSSYMQQHPIPSKQQTKQKSKQSKWRKVPNTTGLYQYVPSGTYFANVRRGNRGIRESLKTKDLAIAKRLLRDFVDRLDRCDWRAGKMTLVDWLTKHYFPTLKGAEGTLSDKWRIIQRLKRTWLAARSQPLRDLKASQVAAWLNEWYGGQSTSSYNGALCLLRDALQAAVTDHVLMESPAAHLKYRRRQKLIRITPDWEQFLSIIADVRAQPFNRDADDSADFLEAMGLLGLGQAELAGMKREHVDLASRRIAIYRRKTSCQFFVPLFPQARSLVERLCEKKKPHQHLFKINQARKALTNACKRLELPLFTQRSLRRMHVTRCLEKGVSPRVVAAWQGHQDQGVLILQTYSHIRPEFEQHQAQLLTTDEVASNIVPMAAGEQSA
jgi:integrase